MKSSISATKKNPTLIFPCFLTTHARQQQHLMRAGSTIWGPTKILSGFFKTLKSKSTQIKISLLHGSINYYHYYTNELI